MPDNELEPPPTSRTYAARLLEFLDRKGKEISPLLILPHDYPDPDALAAAFALQYLAQQRFEIETRIEGRLDGLLGRRRRCPVARAELSRRQREVLGAERQLGNRGIRPAKPPQHDNPITHESAAQTRFFIPAPLRAARR